MDSKDSPGFLLWRTQIAWKRLIEKTLRVHNLTHPQFVILATTAFLTQNDRNVTQIELSKHTSCDINTTSQVLRSLEKNGLIKRIYKAGNEKSKYPKLTELGYSILKPAIQAVENADEIFFGNLNQQELEDFQLITIKLTAEDNLQ